MGQAKPIKNNGIAHGELPEKESGPASLAKDAATTSLIHSLTLLMACARQHNLGNATRILATAREDLVYWAVDMNFHESAKDQFVHRHLYGVGAASELLICVSHMRNRDAQYERLLLDFNDLVERATLLASQQLGSRGK